MTSPELATAFAAGLIGVALGALMMAWHGYRAEKAALDAWADARKRWRESADRYEAAVTDLHTVTAERDELQQSSARIASLTASLGDAHAEVSRLTGEKHALATQLHAVKEIVGGY